NQTGFHQQPPLWRHRYLQTNPHDHENDGRAGGYRRDPDTDVVQQLPRPAGERFRVSVRSIPRTGVLARLQASANAALRQARYPRIPAPGQALARTLGRRLLLRFLGAAWSDDPL